MSSPSPPGCHQSLKTKQAPKRLYPKRAPFWAPKGPPFRHHKGPLLGTKRAPIRAPKGPPFGPPKGTKIGPKGGLEQDQKGVQKVPPTRIPKISKTICFPCVLAQTGGPFGHQKGPLLGTKRTPFWAPKGPPFWAPKGALLVPKRAHPESARSAPGKFHRGYSTIEVLSRGGGHGALVRLTE